MHACPVCLLDCDCDDASRCRHDCFGRARLMREPSELAQMKLPRVQIVARTHPHFEEYGRFTGKIITMKFPPFTDMAEVKLENCRHGGDGCFVCKGEVREVPER